MKKKIWIDLDNAPHVPFFAPIIGELEARGHSVLVTARDRFRVRELATMHNIPHVLIGKDYGKNKLKKVLGLCYRALQLGPFVLRERPDLAVSHGSRSQVILSKLVGIPSVVIFDYEHTTASPFVVSDFLMVPEVIPNEAISIKCRSIGKYPGIKEDVYVPGFRPTAGILEGLGIEGGKIVVTVRPPASDAHYHRAVSDELFRETIAFISADPQTVIVLLPRNEKQETAVRESWPDLLKSGKLVIPDQALDGLNLIWHSDLVISGGGTMNREAAALGVPVYSIFRGETGYVDRYLSGCGRLTLIESAQDLQRKIRLEKWRRPERPGRQGNGTLLRIVEELEDMLKRSTIVYPCDISRGQLLGKEKER